MRAKRSTLESDVKDVKNFEITALLFREEKFLKDNYGCRCYT